MFRDEVDTYSDRAKVPHGGLFEILRLRFLLSALMDVDRTRTALAWSMVNMVRIRA